MKKAIMKAMIAKHNIRIITSKLNKAGANITYIDGQKTSYSTAQGLYVGSKEKPEIYGNVIWAYGLSEEETAERVEMAIGKFEGVEDDGSNDEPDEEEIIAVSAVTEDDGDDELIDPPEIEIEEDPTITELKRDIANIQEQIAETEKLVEHHAKGAEWEETHPQFRVSNFGYKFHLEKAQAELARFKQREAELKETLKCHIQTKKEMASYDHSKFDEEFKAALVQALLLNLSLKETAEVEVEDYAVTPEAFEVAVQAEIDNAVGANNKNSVEISGYAELPFDTPVEKTEKLLKDIKVLGLSATAETLIYDNFDALTGSPTEYININFKGVGTQDTVTTLEKLFEVNGILPYLGYDIKTSEIQPAEIDNTEIAETVYKVEGYVDKSCYTPKQRYEVAELVEEIEDLHLTTLWLEDDELPEDFPADYYDVRIEFEGVIAEFTLAELKNLLRTHKHYIDAEPYKITA